jgi:UDP-GlcNAc:undecaprenyl-phosphate GlcNAc-1-phosphate transferase
MVASLLHELLQEVQTIAVSLVVAFFLTAFLIWLLRPLAIKLGLVDNPDHRKTHEGSIPLVGGIAMYLGFTFALLTLNISLRDYRSFLAAAGLLIIVGVLDDFRELTPKKKFAAQIVAVVFMISWGKLIIWQLGPIIPWLDMNLQLGSWDWVVTLIGGLAIINAINLSDGLDGLAGGYSLVAFASMLLLSVSSSAIYDTQLIMLLISLLFAFLLFNMRMPWRKSAAIFMGDAGSMFLGFALVWFIISLTQADEKIMRPVTALWIVALPLFDMVGVSLRRMLKGKPIFQADRSHFHHIFLAAGYSAHKTTLILLTVALCMACVGLLGEYFRVHDSIMFSLFMTLFLLYFFAMQHAWKVMKVISKQSDSTR